MGGGRGLLGRERLGPGGGCSREVLWPRQWPLRRSSRLSSRCANPSLTSSLRDVPREPVPSRAVFAFVPGIAPGSRCCGWASPWSPPPPSPASRPLPRTLGLRAALQLQTGPLLHIGHTTPQLGRSQPPPARRPGLGPSAETCAAAAIAAQCIRRQTAASSDLDPPRRYPSLPQPLDNVSNSWPVSWRGRPAFHLQWDPFPPHLLPETSSVPVRWPPGPSGAWQPH